MTAKSVDTAVGHDNLRVMTEQDDSLTSLIPQVEIWPADAYDALAAQLGEPARPVPELAELFARARTRDAARRLDRVVRRT